MVTLECVATKMYFLDNWYKLHRFIVVRSATNVGYLIISDSVIVVGVELSCRYRAYVLVELVVCLATPTIRDVIVNGRQD